VRGSRRLGCSSTIIGVEVAVGVAVAVAVDVAVVVAVAVAVGVGGVKTLNPIEAFDATYWLVPTKVALNVFSQGGSERWP
jgi:hypothetical protein